MPDTIYLDNPASTPLDPMAAEAMRAAVSGNPHATHALGIQAGYQIEAAKQQILSLAGKGRLIFTSGATEANSLAILGMALRELRLKGQRRKIVSCTTEHASVLELKPILVRLGFELRLVPVSSTGQVNLVRLEEELGRDVLMLSIMTINNETGVMQDWQTIEALAGRTIVHTDAAQALGKLPKLPKRPDLITLSSHKVHGPQGIGALLLRRGPKPDALLRGGGQQQGLRSGTLPTALCVGFGACCATAQTSLARDLTRIANLSECLNRGICDLWPGAKRVGGPCVPGIVYMQLPGTDARQLLNSMPGVAASTGSACDARTDRVSHVLRAMRVRDGRSCIRLGISRMTTRQEIDRFLNLLDTARRNLLA